MGGASNDFEFAVEGEREPVHTAVAFSTTSLSGWLKEVRSSVDFRGLFGTVLEERYQGQQTLFPTQWHKKE